MSRHQRLIDVSHTVEHGLVTYRGLIDRPPPATPSGPLAILYCFQECQWEMHEHLAKLEAPLPLYFLGF